MSSVNNTPGSSSPGSDAGRGLSAHAARLRAMIMEAVRAAGRVMDTPITGPRGQQMSLTEAQQHAHAIQNKIAMDEARGSLRHRTVSRMTKLLTLLFLSVIDFPIMLWLASSVFNVDWSNPIGLPLAISIVISLLGTAGSAWVLHHIGHNRRENKNDRRQLVWADLSAGVKISLVAIGLLAALIAVAMFARVYTEGVLSGLDGLALLLAVLIAFVMLLSAAMVFSAAFRDGSPEQDDLAHYSGPVQNGLQRKRALEDRADQLRNELEMLLDGGNFAAHSIDAAEPTRTMTMTTSDANTNTTGAAIDGIRRVPSIENVNEASTTDDSLTRRSLG